MNEAGSGLQGDPDRCKTRTDDFYFLQSNDPKHLVICNPKKEHTGQYKCRARNFLDEKEASVFINVQSEYRVTTTSSEEFLQKTLSMVYTSNFYVTMFMWQMCLIIFICQQIKV